MAGKGRNIDMTVGDPRSVVLRYSVPLVCSSLLTQLYNMMDSIVVGRFLGTNALAAVGATTWLNSLLMLLITCLTSAFTVLCAQAIGAKKNHLVRKVLVCALYIIVLGTVVLFSVGVFLSKPLTRLMQVDPVILDDAAQYLRITVSFCGGHLIYSGMTSILNATGDSRTPLYFLIISSILNVVLNIIFVVPLHMGVAGVAWATVIAQHISAVIAVVYSFKTYPVLRFGLKDLKPDMRIMKEAAKLGVAGSVQSFANTLGEAIISARVNSYGAVTAAAFSLVGQLVRVASLSFNAIASGNGTFASQNLGAGRPDRVREGFRKITVITVSVALAWMVIYLIFGKYFIMLYLKPTDPGYQAVLKEALKYTRIYVSGFFFLAIIWMYNRTLTGLGMAPATMVSGLVEICFKLLGALVLPIWIGTTGLMLATPSGWILGAVPSIIVYHSGKWEKKGNRLKDVD